MPLSNSFKSTVGNSRRQKQASILLCIFFPVILLGSGDWGDASPCQDENSFFLYSRFIRSVSFRTCDYYVPLTIIASYPLDHETFLEPSLIRYSEKDPSTNMCLQMKRSQT